MASEDSFLVLVHHRGSVKRKTRSGVKFTDKDPLCIVVSPTTSYDALVSSVLVKLGVEGVKRVKKFYYRIPTTVLHDTVKYDCFTIGSDEDLQVMFLSRRQFPEVRTPELLAKFGDVVSSSGGSNRNANTIATVAGSSSRPTVASSSIPVYVPAVQPAASPSFAVDLSGNVGDQVGYGEHLPTDVRCPTPAGVGEGLCEPVKQRRGTRVLCPLRISGSSSSIELESSSGTSAVGGLGGTCTGLDDDGPATECDPRTTNLVVDHPGDMSNSIQTVKPPRIVSHRLNMPIR
ncbi:hypothetical protein Ahy_B08g092816 [Arachis hypogaea]|uniref:Uncharacterized protein n=1 Tax=Arachis hypogaea TaxID=3818 RepID=A0A444Y4N7_ARAHY|nr:hypothetical protein Ahy_B08g092816 [Arachis hypogaea]